MSDSISSAPSADQRSTDLSEDLERHGVVTVLTATYEWGGYRYSTARDALAAAKRALK